MTTTHELDLTDKAANLELSADGLWVARGDADLGFASGDETDWVDIEERSFWYQHRNEVILDILQRFPYKEWLYEIGAGNGAVCAAIQRAGSPVVAIEPTVAWARNAKYRGLKHVICAHFQRAEFLKGTLDNVALFDVLEHVADDAAFLADLKSLMPSGGRIYLTVPALKSLWSHEDEQSGHYRRYTASGLRDRLRAAGFREEYSSYFFAPLVPAILIARALPYRIGLGRARTHASTAADHGVNKSKLTRYMSYILRCEHALSKKDFSLPFGSSLLAVAVAE